MSEAESSGFLGKLKGMKDKIRDKIHDKMHDKMDTKTPEASENPKCVKMPNGISQIFKKVYHLIAGVCFVCFIGLFLLSIGDIILYLYTEIQQKYNLDKNQKMMFKDTYEMSALSYLKPDMKKEILNVFAESKCISFILILAGLGVILLGCHVGYFTAMGIYSNINQVEFDETLDIPTQPLIAILFAGGGATVLNTMYKRNFVEKTQMSLKTIRDQMRDIKKNIYDMMFMRKDFLDALTTNDGQSLQRILVDISKKCANRSGSCSEFQKAIFTISLYTYYKDTIAASDDAYTEVMKMFTVDNIRSRDVDPVKYFYYKDVVYIPNVYVTWSADEQSAFFVGTSGRNTDVESEMLTGLTNKMGSINDKLVKIRNINAGKKNLFNYIMAFFVLNLVIMILLGLILFGPQLYAWYKNRQQTTETSSSEA